MSEASRWQQVKALFEAAVERPPAERAAFVAAAAADDDDLRRKVESLLAADAQAVNFDESLHDPLSTVGVRSEWPWRSTASQRMERLNALSLKRGLSWARRLT